MSTQEFRKYIDIINEAEDPAKKQASLVIADGLNQIASSYEQGAEEADDEEYAEYFRSNAADLTNIADIFSTQGYDAGWDNFLLDTEPREAALEKLSQILGDDIKAVITRLGTGAVEYNLQ
jgi:hypothetical protein